MGREPTDRQYLSSVILITEIDYDKDLVRLVIQKPLHHSTADNNGEMKLSPKNRNDQITLEKRVTNKGGFGAFSHSIPSF